MTVKGGTRPACAACKYQRRKCSPECLLAPYFPADNPKRFQNVHRLYRVSKIQKMLEGLEKKEQREDAMKSVIYESDMRARYPVHGCSLIIQQLQHELEHATQELQYVYEQLDACKNNHHGGSTHHFLPTLHQKYVVENEMTSTMNQFLANESHGLDVISEEVNHYMQEQGSSSALDVQNNEQSSESSSTDSIKWIEHKPQSVDFMRWMEHKRQNELTNAGSCFNLTTVS